MKEAIVKETIAFFCENIIKMIGKNKYLYEKWDGFFV